MLSIRIVIRRLLVAPCLLALTTLPAAPPPNIPNVIVILADDLGYGDLSCYGGWIPTPHLDRLAREGVRLTDFHSNGAVCSPTRAALMTGCYPQRVGIPAVVTAKNHRDKGLPPRHFTIARLAKSKGYKTGIFGKWHLGYAAKYNPIHHGFDRFAGYVSGNVDYFSHIDQTGVYDWWHGDKQAVEPGYVTHLIRDHSVKFIAENSSRPFFLYVAHEAPHYPYQGPDDKAERTAGGELAVRGSRPDKKNAYREMVIEMDKSVGDIVKSLRKHDIHKRTLVFFFSDNGANRVGSNGGLRGFKGSVWEGGHRVPAIAWWPGKIPAGRECASLILTMDILPMLAHVLGAELPPGRTVDGIDIWPALMGTGKLTERTVFWRTRRQAAARRGPWKLITSRRGRHAPRLYNLREDRGEARNVRQAAPEVAARLERQLKEWEEAVGPDEFGS